MVRKPLTMERMQELERRDSRTRGRTTAYNRALKRLRLQHLDEFEAFFREEDEQVVQELKEEGLI